MQLNWIRVKNGRNEIYFWSIHAISFENVLSIPDGRGGVRNEESEVSDRFCPWGETGWDFDSSSTFPHHPWTRWYTRGDIGLLFSFSPFVIMFWVFFCHKLFLFIFFMRNRTELMLSIKIPDIIQSYLDQSLNFKFPSVYKSTSSNCIQLPYLLIN